LKGPVKRFASGLFCVSVWLLSLTGFAADESNAFKVPSLTGPVMDLAGVIEAPVATQLEQILRHANSAGRIQMTILTLKSLGELPIEQASIQIVDAWKLGAKGKDNGLLFLVVPSEKKARIEVGQGLEGEIPDILAKRILAEISRPYFKANRYSDGIMAGTLNVLKLLDPDGKAEAAGLPAVESPPEPAKRGRSGLPDWAIILIFIIIIILRITGRGFFIGGGGFGGGGWGGGSGGGGWSGGGGGFSGGGSSDSW
jgi:uncharacterized protein